MKLNKFAYFYSKPLRNHTLKIMKKYLEIYLKTWKNHGNIMEFCQSGKVGTLPMRHGYPPSMYGLQAGGMHPTAMLSCTLFPHSSSIVSAVNGGS